MHLKLIRAVRSCLVIPKKYTCAGVGSQNYFTVLTADRHFAEAGEDVLLLARMKNWNTCLPANPR